MTGIQIAMKYVVAIKLAEIERLWPEKQPVLERPYNIQYQEFPEKDLMQWETGSAYNHDLDAAHQVVNNVLGKTDV